LPRALLLDLAVNPDPLSVQRVALVLKLVKYPAVLATMAAGVFDDVSHFPYIVEDIKLLDGPAAGLAYGTELYRINRMRVADGREPLPIRFTDEIGRPHNIIYMSDYQHLRRAAA
jgi:hypothetical protein